MIQDKLWMLADGELSKAERQAISLHLKSCAECAGLLKDWKAVQRKVAHLPQPEASEVFVKRVMNRLPQAPVYEPVRSQWHMPGWMALRFAVGLASAVGLAFVFIQQTPLIATETLLLTGLSEGDEWEFLGQPDTGWLLGMTSEAP